MCGPGNDLCGPARRQCADLEGRTNVLNDLQTYYIYNKILG